jgi:hypothetical protein
MSSTAMADVSTICRRPLIAAKLFPREVAANTPRPPGFTLHRGGEVDGGLFAARFRVVSLLRKKDLLTLKVKIPYIFAAALKQCL